ncbi:MAG: cholesterol oxidase [Acidobacteria bacterium RBG_13_68_16]|nr:MAG: cholesterol oxidase [Acidobacteria bacterium RBG_13_68_16]
MPSTASSNVDAYDFIIVGSGFGGSVSALRLAEKGYRVLVVEAGKRFLPEDFPKTNWNVRKFLWMPALFCYGIQRLTLLRDVLVLSGAGVGGGSLVYANTLLLPPDDVFERDSWPAGSNWKARLAPHYETARRMLGVTRAPRVWAGDDCLRRFAERLGRPDTFHHTEVGVLFGERPGEDVGDPYFAGEGPARSTCNYCGGCMVGCRYNAKNTLDRNYLFFAEKLGAEILPETLVTLLEPDGNGGYLVHTRRSTHKVRRGRRTLRAHNVVLAAGAMGTTDLLLRCREAGTLPALPSALGSYVRSNSEVLCGATARRGDVNYSEGIAIASGFYATPDTHLEVVRYSEGSDFMSFLATLQTDGGTRLTRPLKWIWTCLRHPVDFLRALVPFGWARRTVILLVMQTVENSLRLVRRRHWYWPFARKLGSQRDPSQPPIPSYIPVANQAARAMAECIGGFPSSAINEVALNVPITAHILGGACMGTGPDRGVVDERNRVFGHEGLWVVDGAAVPVNLGVNPSLTITAIAEHAMSTIPPKDPAEGLRPLPLQARATSVAGGPASAPPATRTL